MTDHITVSALVLAAISIIGIFYKQKWGATLAIGKCMFDIILRLWFFSLGYTGTILIIVLTLILTLKEYQYIEVYWQSVVPQTISLN